MATYTTNFNLEKPAQNEAVDVDVLNSNSDIIDDNLGQARQLALNIGYGYNNAVPYFVGDYCVYQNKLYKCIQNILTPEDFDETKWQQCTLGGELQNIKGNTDDNVTDVLVKLKIGEKVYKICDFANKNLANEYSASRTYEVGDYVIYEDDLYKCITAVSTAEPFDSNKWDECLVTDELGSGGGGGNADIVHLTQAEYDALPYSKLTDDKVYMITDTNGDGSQFQPVIYSENEREIGVWTDGKPLYEITIDCGELPNNTSKNITTPTNIEHLIDAFGCVTDYDGNDRVMPFAGGGSNDVRVDLSDGNLRIMTFAAWVGYYAFVTVRYTKTTDTAGSGTWTPQGVPAVHYSTDEKVVGTWIDGSTLYEKTVIASISDVNSHEYSDNDLSNSDMAMIIDGYYILTDNFIKVPLNQWESSTYYTRAGFRSDKTIYLYANGYSVTGNAYITVRYTKSSQGGN